MIVEYFVWFLKSQIPVTVYLIAVLIITKLFFKAPEVKAKVLSFSAFLLLLIPCLFPFAPNIFSDDAKISLASPEKKQGFAIATIENEAVKKVNEGLSEQNNSKHLLTYLLFIWLLGMFGYLIYLIIGYVYLRRFWYLRQEKANTEWASKINSLSQTLGIKKEVRLRFSRENISPCAFGFWNPCLVIPKAMIEKFSWQELKPIFVHELSHIARGDTKIVFVCRLLEAIYFFHPLMWIFSSFWQLTIEMACDREVIIREQNPFCYANSIVNFLEWKKKIGYSHFLWHMNYFSHFKIRLNYMLSKDVKVPNRNYYFSEYFSILIFCFCLLFWGEKRWTNNTALEKKLENGVVIEETKKRKSLPALHITSYDTEDPVEINQTTTYVIEIRNEGTAPCHNLSVINTIPDEAQFISASTQHTLSQQQIVFAPHQILAPGEKTTYEVTIKAISSGSAINRTTVSYQEFSKSLQVEEGTTIYFVQ